MMTRRGSPGIQILIGLVVVGLFLYGFYTYHEVHTRLRRTEEKADRLKTQHESVSAQLQVLYEHKTRLEKSLQEEKAEHKKTRDDAAMEKRELEDKIRGEKEHLEEKISTEIEKAKSLQQKFEEDYNKLTEAKQELQNQIDSMIEEKLKETETQKQQLNQQKQEYENEIAQLKDEIANLQRRNYYLENKKVDVQQQDEDLNRSKDRKNQNVIDPGLNMQIVQPGDNKPKGYFQVKSPDKVIGMNQPKAVAADSNDNVANQDAQQVAAPMVNNEVAAHDNAAAAAAGGDNGGPLRQINGGAGAVPVKYNNFNKENQIEQMQKDRQMDESQIESNQRGAFQRKEGRPGQVVAPVAQGQGQGQMNQPGQIAQPNQFNQMPNAAGRDVAHQQGENFAAGQRNNKEAEEYEEGEDERPKEKIPANEM